MTENEIKKIREGKLKDLRGTNLRDADLPEHVYDEGRGI